MKSNQFVYIVSLSITIMFLAGCGEKEVQKMQRTTSSTSDSSISTDNIVQNAVVPSPCFGDYNRDGRVDTKDLTTLGINFGKTVNDMCTIDKAMIPCSLLDYNGSGDVDKGDEVTIDISTDVIDCSKPSLNPCDYDFDKNGIVGNNDLSVIGIFFNKPTMMIDQTGKQITTMCGTYSDKTQRPCSGLDRNGDGIVNKLDISGMDSDSIFNKSCKKAL